MHLSWTVHKTNLEKLKAHYKQECCVYEEVSWYKATPTMKGSNIECDEVVT